MSGSEKLIESHRAKAAFRESEEHYRAVTEAATDAIITIDSDSMILVINPAAERIFGYSTEEMIGQPVLRLIPEDRCHEEGEILNRLHAGDRIDHYETVRKRKDG